jgi:type IV pilus assembly protein PilC
MHFNYQARTKTGDVKTGFIDASSKPAAAELLRREGLFVTSLKREDEGFKKSFGFFGHVSQKDIALFARQLSVMFKANVSLVESLRTIGGQNSNARFRENILMISKDVEGGTTLSAAFAKYPDIFSAFFISMLRAGEVSGNLSEQLFYLSEYLEKQYYLAGKVRSAMVYPSVILFVVLAVMFLLSYFVMPNLVSMLEASNTELPPITQFVIWFSSLLRGPGGIVFLLGLVGIGVLGFRYSRSEQGKSFIDHLILQIPGVRNMFGMLYLDRFADNLSTLIVGGIPITQALEITSTIVGNVVYREVIQKTVEGVRRGQTISSILFNYPELFPPTFTQMILVGEQTGSLDKSLLTMVSFYEKETDRAIDTLLTLLEPALIIVLGIIVGGLVGSVMIPLYQSMGNM